MKKQRLKTEGQRQNQAIDLKGPFLQSQNTKSNAHVCTGSFSANRTLNSVRMRIKPAYGVRVRGISK